MQFCVIRAAWKPLEPNHRLPAVTAMESSSISSSNKERRRVWKEFKEELYHNGSEWSLGVRWTTWGGSHVMLCPMWGRDNLPGAHWPKRKSLSDVNCQRITIGDTAVSRVGSMRSSDAMCGRCHCGLADTLQMRWQKSNLSQIKNCSASSQQQEILCWVCNS